MSQKLTTEKTCPPQSRRQPRPVKLGPDLETSDANFSGQGHRFPALKRPYQRPQMDTSRTNRGGLGERGHFSLVPKSQPADLGPVRGVLLGEPLLLQGRISADPRPWILRQEHLHGAKESIASTEASPQKADRGKCSF